MTLPTASRRAAGLLSTVLPALLLAAAPAAQDGTAVFEVTFKSTWSRTTHPVSFPGNPHYSPLIGATHDAATSFWRPGGIATPGIEAMAETGATSALRSEIGIAMRNGGARDVVAGSGLGSPASITLRFTAAASHPRLTLVTMLAPSPDWFVGLSGLDLLDKNGRWIDRVSVAATLWDAGTDSGVTYTSPNQNTNPKDKIAVVSTSRGPFMGYSTTVGTWTVQRVASAQVYGCGVNPRGSMRITGGAPLLGRSLSLAVHDPGGSMARGARAFLLVDANASPMFPCGIRIPGFGLRAPGAEGEFLLGGVLATLAGGSWNGTPVPFNLVVPNDPTLNGAAARVQGGLASAARLGLTDAVEVRLGR